MELRIWVAVAFGFGFIIHGDSAFTQKIDRIPTRFQITQPERFSAERNSAGDRKPSVHTQGAAVTGAMPLARMWNAYTSLYPSSCQIDFDPYSNTLIAIYRRAYPDRENVRSGELTYQFSTDGGTSWSGEHPTINVGTENSADQLAARHPSILLTNPTQSANRSQVGLSVLFGQVIPFEQGFRFSEVPYVGGGLNGPFTKGKFGPQPPDYSVPCTPVRNIITGELFTVVEIIDPSIGLELGEYYLASSKDDGRSWSIRVNDPIIFEPVAGSKQTLHHQLDISPDGKTMVVGFIADPNDPGTFFPMSSDLQLGYVKSIDSGATWSSPTLIGFQNLTVADVSSFASFSGKIDLSRAILSSSFDIVVDVNDDIHFLVTVSGDLFYPIDSTFVAEISLVNNQWEIFPLAQINNPYFKRFLTEGALGQAQTVFNIFNEHELAKSVDGSKIYAKWIDTDSSLVTAPRGNPSPYARDTVHNIWMTARDIRSTSGTKGWKFPAEKLTDTPTIDEKLTKIAHTVGDDGTIHLIYTIMADGPNGPDTDDLGEAQLYYFNSTLKITSSGTSTKVVGTSPNAHTSKQISTNQIAYDPVNQQLVVVYNGSRTLHGNQDVVVMNTSTDFGKTWGGESAPMNTGIVNSAGKMAAHFPSVTLYHDGQQLHVATVWSNLTEAKTYDAVGFSSGRVGFSFTNGTWPILGSGDVFGIPDEIAVNHTDGSMYSLVGSYESSTNAPTGRYFLSRSSDIGRSWTISQTPIPLIPPQEEFTVRSTSMDISSDGMVIGVAYIAIPSSLPANFNEYRLGYIESNDGGNTWSAPILKRATDWTFSNLETAKRFPEKLLNPVLDLAIDAHGIKHILVVCSFVDMNNPGNPLSENHIGEATIDGTAYEFFAIAPVLDPVGRKWLSSPPLNPPAQNTFELHNEPQFAKSPDGLKLYAKWIDRSNLNNLVDSTRDVFLCAKDIRVNTERRGWTERTNLTNTTKVDEIQTKMAPIIDKDGRIHLIYTLMADGEFSGAPMKGSNDATEAQITYMTNAVLPVTLSSNGPELPHAFVLEQNYPNPFNPTTRISFTLPTAGSVRLRVMNLLGQEVTTLINGLKEAGRHSVNFNASNLPSGIYTYRLESVGKVITRKMLLVK